MAGYLNRKEATEAVLKEGWYSTGDLGFVDRDGFLKITDRLSRFSKIAGEMVPHLCIEAAIVEATGVDENQVAVTGIPDPKQGERLCVLYSDPALSPADVCHRLNAGPLPKIWIPTPRDFIHVEEIPITSSGKVNLRKLKDIALNHGGCEQVSRKA
jgi:acyl-[acyl-carrier-protein]-phospholipid O-acyltransferase/long-chain-fatty-acid--[acyl-carrier-protein] ligase